MNKQCLPKSDVFWYSQTNKKPNQLLKNIKVDVAIVGGGMAGLSAAQNFRKKGLSVAVLEQFYCGAGASGKSSGFITPDSELNLAHLRKRFGLENADKIWNLIGHGVNIIESNIKNFNLSCDYRVQDSLFVANDAGGFKYIQDEYTTHVKSGYASTLYTKDTIHSVIGSQGYVGGLRYGGCFGINPYAYCQEMKTILSAQGVEIYEESPVVELGFHKVKTALAQVEADHIVVCTDWATSQFGKLTTQLYHAQNFILVSAPLSDVQIHKIFPDTPCMVWDTDLLYQYFRLIGDNRLILGGGTLWQMFAKEPNYNAHSVYNKLMHYFSTKFPGINPQFEYMYPGLIGITKDILAVMGSDPDDDSIYYIAAVTGLPWAAALGHYSAEHLIDKKTDMDSFFAINRSFPINSFLQFFMGKRAAFALSNYISLKF